MMRNSKNDWWIASVMAPPGDRGWTPCIDWCRKAFGEAPTTNINQGAGWYFVGEGVFEFREPEMLTAFMLRWAN